jgi:hypothetical protein
MTLLIDPKPYSLKESHAFSPLQSVREKQSHAISGEWRDLLKDQILDVWAECQKEDWNGEGASPIKKESVYQVLNFLKLLPDGIVEPEISADPSGYILLDWQGERNEMLSLSFEGEQISFAMRVGYRQKLHGVEPRSTELPAIIKEILLSWFVKA